MANCSMFGFGLIEGEEEEGTSGVTGLDPFEFADPMDDEELASKFEDGITEGEDDVGGAKEPCFAA